MENPYLAMLWSAFGQALPYLVFLAAFVIALKWLEAKFTPKRRSRKWRGNRRSWQQQGDKVVGFRPKHDALPDQVPDAADQLRTVMNAEFKVQPLLNKSETKLFMALEKMVAEMTPGWRVMAQVSLGEVLQSKDYAAYRCINSKRVDMLLVRCGVQAAARYRISRRCSSQRHRGCTRRRQKGGASPRGHWLRRGCGR